MKTGKTMAARIAVSWVGAVLVGAVAWIAVAVACAVALIII